VSDQATRQLNVNENGVMSDANLLALVAIGLSAASLIWQAVTWVRSGAVIQVWMIPGENELTVIAYNSGRSAATITAVSATAWNPIVVGSDLIPGSDPIPFRITEGGHGSWRFEVVPPNGTWAQLTPSEIFFFAHVTVGRSKVVHATYDRASMRTSNKQR
jgi:hypothetical protein